MWKKTIKGSDMSPEELGWFLIYAHGLNIGFFSSWMVQTKQSSQEIVTHPENHKKMSFFVGINHQSGSFVFFNLVT